MARRVLCVIPARYGSTRLPAKPLLEINGIPLVMWSYNRAVESGVFSDVCIATDDRRIMETVERFGGKAMMTSPSHKSGTDRVNEVANAIECTHVVNLQGDEPDVPLEIIRNFAAGLDQIDDYGLLTIVSHAKIDEVGSPHVVKAVVGSSGDALYFSRSIIPFDRDAACEQLFYKHHGIYGFTRQSLSRFCSLPQGTLEKRESLEQLRALEHGMRIRCLVEDFVSSGIDTAEDLERFRAHHAK